jgi:hypothetical protein
VMPDYPLNVEPTKWMMLPISEFEFLVAQGRRLIEIINSHTERDVTVTEILSGQEVSWLCGKVLEDLREACRAYESKVSEYENQGYSGARPAGREDDMTSHISKSLPKPFPGEPGATGVQDRLPGL